MFDNDKYMTRGILYSVPVEIQTTIWTMIEKIKKERDVVDYLQVFELTAEYNITKKPRQRIRQFQECPPYEIEKTVECSNPIKEKIYVIDDATHSTMLLASEY